MFSFYFILQTLPVAPPAILVHKDDKFFTYDGNNMTDLDLILHKWLIFVGFTTANWFFVVNFVASVPKDVQEQNISSWFDSEKFSAYIQISRTNFHDVTDTGKSKLDLGKTHNVNQALSLFRRDPRC